MLQIDNFNNIYLTRADSAEFELTIASGESTYDFSSDLVQFTVKANTVTQDIVIQKTFVDGKIQITPTDTKDLRYTELKYDVQLITPNNEVYTVLLGDFIITEEVNFNVSYT